MKLKAIYRGKELVEVDVDEWYEREVKNEISRYILCEHMSEHPYQFYANSKDLKLAFNHYLSELEA